MANHSDLRKESKMTLEKTKNINDKKTEANTQNTNPNVQSKTNKPNNSKGLKGKSFGHKPKDSKGAIIRLTKYIKPQLWIIVIMIICSIASSIFSILIPGIIAQATNEIYYNFHNINLSLIYSVLLKSILMYLGSAAFMLLSGVVSSQLAGKIVYRMRYDLKNKLDKLPLKYFDGNSTGDILSRVTNDIETISNTFQESINQIISGVVTVVGILVMMFLTNIYLTLITLASIPILIISSLLIAKKSHIYFSKTQKNLGELNGFIEESYSGQNIIKLFNKEAAVEEEFDKLSVNLAEEQKKAQFVSGIIMPVANLINNISYAILCVVGGIFAGKGMIKVGVIQQFLMYKRQYSQPINQLTYVINIIQSTLAAAERVFEVMDAKEEDIDKNLVTYNRNTITDIAFKNVDFSYEENKPLIENLNLSVKEGETVAIVGQTGAGKTTLVNLLMRFYEINKGSITINGININDVTRHNLRELYGMVLQDAWVFNGSIKENVAYSKPDATMDEIVKACEEAHIHHYIMTLSEGYDTVLNEDATNISQGQKQLLTIARAILKNPKILILDEATSSVDTRTEQLIQQAMSNLIQNRTSFIIAHRLSTIKNANKILVMDKGSIVEVGNHKELIANKGTYYDLYNSQFNE